MLDSLKPEEKTLVEAILSGVKANRICGAFPKPPMVVSVGLSQVAATEDYPNLHFRIDRNIYRPTVSQLSLSRESHLNQEIEAQKSQIESDTLKLEEVRKQYEWESEAQTRDRESGEGIAPARIDQLTTYKVTIGRLETAIKGAESLIEALETEKDGLIQSRPVLPPIEENPEFTIPYAEVAG